MYITGLTKYIQSFKSYIDFVEFLCYNIQRNLQTLRTIAFHKDLICQKMKKNLRLKRNKH